MVQVIWKRVGQFLIQLKMHVANYLAILLPGFPQEKSKLRSKKGTVYDVHRGFIYKSPKLDQWY